VHGTITTTASPQSQPAVDARFLQMYLPTTVSFHCRDSHCYRIATTADGEVEAGKVSSKSWRDPSDGDGVALRRVV
jgi:hypothetical protein